MVFANPDGGEYEVELFNEVGQSSFKKQYAFKQSSTVNIEWPNKPAPGMYYLRVIDLKQRTEQVEKLRIL